MATHKVYVVDSLSNIPPERLAEGNFFALPDGTVYRFSNSGEMAGFWSFFKKIGSAVKTAFTWNPFQRDLSDYAGGNSFNDDGF